MKISGMDTKREIKFRFWHKNLRRWFEGEDLSIDGSGRIYIWHEGAFEPEWDPDGSLVQYTGLRDKKGNEIYEGDVVTLLIDKEPYAYEIIWEHDHQRFGLVEADGTIEHESWAYTPHNDFDVIGSVHENPELLTP